MRPEPRTPPRPRPSRAWFRYAAGPDRRNCGLLVLAVLTLTAGSVRAQTVPEGYVLDTWTTADGLPVNGLTDVVQTRDGFLWIASWDGLARFDGLRFEVFNRSNTPGLPSNRLFDLYETRDGRLWIRTEDNRLAWMQGGTVTPVAPEDGLDGTEVSGLFVGRDSTMLVATETGLHAWTDGRFVRRWLRTDAGPGSGAGLNPSAVLEEADGTLWIGTYEAGLFRHDGSRTERITTSDGARLSTVGEIERDDRGRIWVFATPWQANREEGTARGLFVAENGVLVPVRLDDPAERARRLSALIRFPVPGGPDAIVSDGLVFRAAERGGPATGEAESWSLFGREPDDRVGRRSWQRWNVFFREDGWAVRLPWAAYGFAWDHEGSLWVATNGGGLLRYRPVPFRTIGPAEGLGPGNFYPVLVDRSGSVWTATLGNNGVLRFDPKRPVESSTLLRGEEVLSFHEDHEGGIWVGTNTGTCRFDPSPASGDMGPCRWLELPGDRSERIFAIHEDRQGGLWFAGDRTLRRFADGKWAAFSEPFATASMHADRPRRQPKPRLIPVRQALPESQRIRAIAEDSRGFLWFGAAKGGLSVFVPDETRSRSAGRFHRITRRDGLPSDAIRDLAVDPDGYLWVVTEDAGLARIDGRAGVQPSAWPIVPIGTADGLPESAIHAIEADAVGRFWITSNRGIFWVDREELSAYADGRAPDFGVALYTERDGLSNAEFNGGFSPPSARAPDGRLWFPNQAGLVSVDPAAVVVEDAPATRIDVVSSDTARWARPERVTLEPDQRSFDITYAAITFLVPETVRFRYRLRGYDDQWVEADARRTAFYTKVPAGTYAFEVVAAARDGRWGQPSIPLTVVVRPYAYETLWFRALALLGVVAIVAGGFRLRLRRLHERQSRLEAAVAARTREVTEEKSRTERALATVEEQASRLIALDAAKSRFFANISHEFRTPLTLILGPLQQVLDRGDVPDDAKRSLDLLRRNARRLSHLINQLLDLARIDAGGLTLVLRRHDFGAFVRQSVSLFESLARLRGITLAFEEPCERLLVSFDAEKIEKVILNLLSNAIKFTAEGGSVTATAGRLSDGSVFLSVADTGIGIPADRLERVFDRFYPVDDSSTRRGEGSGIGLALARELVALHQGALTVESEVGVGTTFTLRLPDRPTDLDSPGPEPERPDPEPAATGGFEAQPAATAAQGVAGNDLAETTATVESARSLVLLVEDNADLRVYVRSLLEPEFEVVESHDGRSGLETAMNRVPDLVLSDVMMGGMDGFELCVALKADVRTSHVPVVLLTARADEQSRISGLETGADDYLAKPFLPDELRVRIRNLVEQRRMLRARFSQSVLVLGVDEVLLPPREVEFLETVRSLVQDHLHDADFGVDALAEHVGMGRRQFERKLNSLIGEAPGSMIRRMRLERAAQLLRAGGAQVKEVAAAVGYRSTPHFSEAFLQTYGVAPSVFPDRE